MTNDSADSEVRLPLSPEAEKLCAAAAYKAARGAEPHALQWALAIAETAPELLRNAVSVAQAGQLRSLLRSAIARGDAGPELSRDRIVKTSSALAAADGRPEVKDADIVRAVLEASGTVLESIGGNAPTPSSEAVPAPASGVAPTPYARVAHARSRPVLERLTTNLTEAARQGKLAPVVGRAAEMDLMVETLCRVTKRNPALVGPAGVGKTAIVEGLAQRLAAGHCPDLIRDTTIYTLQPASLLAGAGSAAEYAERVQNLIREASDPGVILFVDEMHSLLERGAGVEQDLVTLLKPALARGDLACIAATTDDEYRRIIEADTALERRFQPVRIGEMTTDETLAVLRAHRERLASRRDVRASDAVLRRILDLSRDRMPNRRFPDKAVDVLEQAVAHAVYSERRTVDQGDVGTVIERLTGTPADMPARLGRMRSEVARADLLSDEDADALVRQLRVATAGLDIRPERPNAVVIMQGEAAHNAEGLAAIVAEHLAGAAERVVSVDFSVMVHPADITRLIGAGPSYVGYGDQLPIHALIQYPWSVLHCQDVDLCHSTISAALANALRRGVIVDGLGRSIRLCDCVVVLTAGRDRPEVGSEPIGLRRRDAREAPGPEPPLGLSLDLVEVANLVVSRSAHTKEGDVIRWMAEEVLPALAKRYKLRGLEVEWDQGVAAWAVAIAGNTPRRDLLESQTAARLGEYLLQYVPASGKAHVRVLVAEEGLTVEPIAGRRRRA